MKIFRFLLLLCLPAFLLSPIPSYTFESKTFQPETRQKLFIPRDDNGLINPWGYFCLRNVLTYLDGYVDHVFGFIDLLSDINFLERLCDEEAERVIDFVIFFLRFSVPKNRLDLAEKYEQEIEALIELMHEDVDDEREYQLSSNRDVHSEFIPAACYEKPEFLLCKKKKNKGWFERKWHHFTHWVDKNKEPLIAVGAVAIGATIIALTMGGGAGAGVAIGGALAGLAVEDDLSPPHINKPGDVRFRGKPPEYVSPPSYSLPEDNSFSALPSEDFQCLDQNFEESLPELTYEELSEEVEFVKEEILEVITGELFDDSHSSIKEYARNLVSEFAHEIVDDLSEMTKSVGVVGGLLGQFVDENYQETLQETYFHIHEAIDRGLGTDIGYFYTQQGKEEAAYLKEKLGIDILKETDQELASAGLIPPGGALATGVRAVTKGKGAGPVAAAAAGATIVGSTLKPVVPVSVEQSVSVYRSFDKNTGEVNYVGITNNFPRRSIEHWKQKGIEIEPIPGLNSLSQYDARAIEQALIVIHRLQKNGGTLTNKINSIAKKNPIEAEAVKRGLEILKEKEYNGLKDINE
ncbi:hypothetical protein [Simkania negevensis]|uniref:GIY-YIG domain-containing protein n=1 Tax=Simkania negevensis (strain ATCC VR-1471 / DSM 27360 / Z) TaxID=331113 RepID=F8L551_SIMNZ|nr:hypothetical protein [Simkania negevensis]CCB87932.1 hypothetical protein SNE_A00540 [Simkania negevensis Z]